MSLSAVTSCHSLMSRPMKLSAGASLRSWKPPAGKKIKSPFLCFALDPKTSSEHQFNISPVALVHLTMPPTSTPQWKIQEDDKNKSVQLTFFNIPEQAKEGDFQVLIDDDVLIIKTTDMLNKQVAAAPPPQVTGAGGKAGGSVSFHVRLLMPKGYNKDGVRAEIVLRALVVTVAKASHPDFKKEIAVERK
uniref:SHSP domain-containing protein n=1 Tax=Leersia perrieri TaxID=77586 RepID=A0A0D9XY56_9ORYZ